MQQDINLYEKRVVLDKEFPINIQLNHYSLEFGRYQFFLPHWHEDIEIHYIRSGEMGVVLDQKDIHMKPGDLVVVNRNVLHSGHRIPQNAVRNTVIILNLAALSRELAEKIIAFPQFISGDPVIGEIMGKLEREYEAKEPQYRLVCKGLVLQLLAHLARQISQDMIEDKESMKRMQKQERFKPVISYIGKHYAEPLSNKELAEIVHLGEDRFNHLFKECTGLSPLQYVNEIRMEKAMNFLKMGQYTSSEVAEMVGVTDYNHFGRLFRRTYGCTPSQVLKGEAQARLDSNT